MFTYALFLLALLATSIIYGCDAGDYKSNGGFHPRCVAPMPNRPSGTRITVRTDGTFNEYPGPITRARSAGTLPTNPAPRRRSSTDTFIPADQPSTSGSNSTDSRNNK